MRAIRGFGKRICIDKIFLGRNGAPCNVTVQAYAKVCVTINDFDPEAVYTVRVAYPPLSLLEEASRTVIAKLQKTQGSFASRDKLLKNLLRAKNVNSLANRVWLYDLTDTEKARLTETIFQNEDTSAQI